MKCPNCNKEVPDGSKFCNHCGHKFEQENTIKCTNPDCGHMIPADSKFCPDCGAKINVVGSVLDPSTNDEILDILTIGDIVLGDSNIEEKGLSCSVGHRDWLGETLDTHKKDFDDPQIIAEVESKIAFASRFFMPDYIPTTWRIHGVAGTTSTDCMYSCLDLFEKLGFYREFKGNSCLLTKHYKGKWLVLFIDKDDSFVEVFMQYVDEKKKKCAITAFNKFG